MMWGIWIYAIMLTIFSIISHFSSTKSLEDTYKDSIGKQEILSQIRINVLKSSELEKEAVMALTDEESKTFANQSSVASSEVEQNLKRLHTIIDGSSLQNEKKLIVEFDGCWTDLRKLDQTILELAVQNTNLKAAALSREKGGEAIGRFEHALGQIDQYSTHTSKEVQIEKSICRAITDSLTIYNLHSPHIAEANDEKMDQIEAQIKSKKNEVIMSLAQLSEFTGEESKESLLQAKAAFSDFMNVTATVIKLSRQNSNIKSLEISLGQKRKVTAQCDEVLSAFQEAVQGEKPKVIHAIK